jgi:DHA3 family multidrug efflux protein-like MFS transporter
MIAGIYLVFTAAFGIWFGSLVDHNPKRTGDAGLERGVVGRSMPSGW